MTAVLQATIPGFGLILAWISLPTERITRLKVMAVGLGIIGVVIIFADQLHVDNAMAFWGCVGVVVGAYASAHASVLVKARAGELHPALLVFGQMVCGLPPILAYSFIVEGNPLKLNWTWQAIACVLYLTVLGTVVALWLYYWLLSKVESTKAMMIAVVTPLIAVVIGGLALDEQLPPQTFFGGTLIVVSIVLIGLKRSGADEYRLTGSCFAVEANKNDI